MTVNARWRICFFFTRGDAHDVEIIKLTNYRRYGVKTKITYKGEAKEDSKAPQKKP